MSSEKLFTNPVKFYKNTMHFEIFCVLDIGAECPLQVKDACKEDLICKKKDNFKIGTCSREDPGKIQSISYVRHPSFPSMDLWIYG